MEDMKRRPGSAGRALNRSSPPVSGAELLHACHGSGRCPL